MLTKEQIEYYADNKIPVWFIGEDGWPQNAKINAWAVKEWKGHFYYVVLFTIEGKDIYKTGSKLFKSLNALKGAIAQWPDGLPAPIAEWKMECKN